MIRMLIAMAFVATASGAAAQELKATLTEFKLVVSHDTVKAGAVTFRVTNGGRMNHALYVRGPGLAKGTADMSAGSSATLTVTLRPGTYDVYCPLSDGSHRMAGMEMKLVVTAAEAPATKKPHD